MPSSSSSSSAAALSASSGGFASVMSILVDLCIVFVSHIGYVVQYVSIARTGNIDGYACLVSLILLTSNTLRVFYFIRERYALALLFQALVALLVHGALLVKVLQLHAAQLWLEEDANQPPLPSIVPADATEAERVAATPWADASKPSAPNTDATGTAPDKQGTFPSVGASSTPVPVAGPTPAHHTHQVDPNEFVLYRLEDMLTERLLRHSPASFLYTYAISAVAALVFILIVMYGILGVPSVVGYVALAVEAMLVVPQILRNARRKSTEGLTLFLVFTWIFGDFAKIIYFFVKSQPLPFIVCGFLQIALDSVVVAQLWFYRRSQQAEFLVSGLQGIGSDAP